MTVTAPARFGAFGRSGATSLFAVSSNRGAAYDLVLLAHVLAAFAAFAVVGVAGGYALRLRQAGELPESVSRYYRPGVNWAGRILFAVPLLGVALIAMSRRAWSFSDGWVGIGLVLWAVAACAAEMVLWPTERRLQQLVAEDPGDYEARRGLCLLVAGVSGGLLVLFVVVTVVMVSKP